MAVEIKGQFITTLCNLLETSPEVKVAAFEHVKQVTGKSYDKLDPQGWYPIRASTGILEMISKEYTPVLTRVRFKTMGSNVYPTMKAHGGIPADVNTPGKLMRFEAEGYMKSHRGAEVVPHKILKDAPNEFIVQVDLLPGTPSAMYEGVYLGILKMCGISSGIVRVTEKDGHTLFHVNWS